jgi:hypothetical protein
MGPDGAAGFGREPSPSPSFGDDLELVKRCPSFGEGSESFISGTSLALYDWPFAASDMMCEMNSKPSNERQRQKSAPHASASAMPELLPPLKPPLARPTPSEKVADLGSRSAGASLGSAFLDHKGAGLISPRLAPQLLPPMMSPRAG